MSVTCSFNGRLGNILFNMAMVIAYCKKHNLQYHFPTYAWACIDAKVPIQVENTGSAPINPTIYTEPSIQGNPYYVDIPAMDNVEFRGYYQSFKYFEEYRQEVLQGINLPIILEPGIVGVHVRLGDCIPQPEGFPIAPKEYYDKAIRYMINKGYKAFRIYSDTPQMARELYLSTFPECTFEYREGYTDVQDFLSLAGCEHIITARSTFSLMASWFNPNPDKIILCPSIEQHYWWLGQNKDMLTGTEHWLTQLNW